MLLRARDFLRLIKKNAIVVVGALITALAMLWNRRMKHEN
jgi:hypothetical protein